MPNIENKDYIYFDGTISSISQESYVDKKDNVEKPYWRVIVQADDGQELYAAIFNPEKFKKTPETIKELENTKIKGSYVVDADNRKQVFLFGPRENKKSFLQSRLLESKDYVVNISKVEVFASKTGNMFVKYILDPNTLGNKLDETTIAQVAKSMGQTLEQIKNQMNAELRNKQAEFEKVDWGIVQQISSVAPNKNGKMVKPIQMSDGRMFDPIATAVATLASVIIKFHNDSPETKVKWSKANTIASLNKAIDAKDIEGLKELTSTVQNLSVFLNIKDGNPEINPEKQYGKISAFEAKKRK